MTSVKIVDLCEAFALNVKNEIDTVQPEIRKPEAETSGLKKLGESELQPSTHPLGDGHILAGSPKSYNTLGENMTTPFHKFPQLRDSDEYKRFTPYQRSILLALIENVIHSSYTYDFFGTSISLQAGQICTTLKTIAEWSGEGTTIKMVRTCLKNFESYGWISVEVLEKKENMVTRGARYGARSGARCRTLITLKFRGLYGSNKELKGTLKGTVVDNDGHINIESISSKSIPIPDSNYLNAGLGGCGNVHNSASTPAEIYFDRERKKLMNIYEEDFQRWEAMFPNVNVRAEIALLCEHEAKKPSRKSHTSWERRIISWLKKANPIQQNLVDKKEEEDIELRIQKNRENTLKELKLWNIKKASVEAYNQHVEFVIGTMKTEVVKYEEKNFWTIFKSKLLQYGEKKV
jgi:hypothetical protein